MRILARQGNEIFLAFNEDEDNPLGVVVSFEVEPPQAFPPFYIHSIIARGYWDKYEEGDSDMEEEILKMAKESFAKGNV